MIVETKGQLPDPNVFRGTCYHCHARVRCARSELSNYYSGDQREPGEFGTVRCPTLGCGHNINMYAK